MEGWVGGKRCRDRRKNIKTKDAMVLSRHTLNSSSSADIKRKIRIRSVTLVLMTRSCHDLSAWLILYFKRPHFGRSLTAGDVRGHRRTEAKRSTTRDE